MVGQHGPDGLPPYADVDATRAQALLAAGAVVIDVRQPDEWQRGHIPGARLIPLDGIYAFGHTIRDLPAETDLVFVCEMGQRSAVACEIALVAGYAAARVHNLTGGMSAWRRLQLPTER
jgi:rhodanese-related sulfurtransferase